MKVLKTRVRRNTFEAELSLEGIAIEDSNAPEEIVGVSGIRSVQAILSTCDSNGNYTLINCPFKIWASEMREILLSSGQVRSLVYGYHDSTVFLERFTFQQYVRMGRPKRIRGKATFDYYTIREE